jgi:hypothetical protein
MKMRFGWGLVMVSGLVATQAGIAKLKNAYEASATIQRSGKSGDSLLGVKKTA